MENQDDSYATIFNDLILYEPLFQLCLAAIFTNEITSNFGHTEAEHTYIGYCWICLLKSELCSDVVFPDYVLIQEEEYLKESLHPKKKKKKYLLKSANLTCCKKYFKRFWM